MNIGRMNKMMRQVQKMQEDMARVQEELADKTVEGSAGGGVVKVESTGKLEIRKVSIAPEAVEEDDIEMLEDLVAAAVNDALRRAREMAEADMAKVTEGINLPNIPGMPF